MSTATALRAQGQADVLAADSAIHRGYAELVGEAIRALGAHGLTFTAEDLRRWIEERHPDAEPHHPNVMGAVIGSLVSAGHITAVGHVRCTRVSRRAGWMRAYRTSAKHPATSTATP